MPIPIVYPPLSVVPLINGIPAVSAAIVAQGLALNVLLSARRSRNVAASNLQRHTHKIHVKRDLAQIKTQNRLPLNQDEANFLSSEVGDLVVFVDNNNTSDRLPLQYVPQQHAYKRNPHINEIELVGRNLPQYHFVGGSTTLKLRVSFTAESEDKTDAMVRARWLESFAIKGDTNTQPPKLRLLWGDLYQEQKWVLLDYQCSHKLYDKQANMLPTLVYCDLELGLDHEDDLSPIVIRENTGYGA